LAVCALLGRARRARGCVTPGDDRLETRAYAVKRYLFRLGHAARSGRYATSVGQLVAGLAPVMGWGPVPRGGPERARFVRVHRKSVQRWLDDLEAAGLVAHEPERDAEGRWWRTQIVLLQAPEPTAEELAFAARRARGWRARQRRRLAPLPAIRRRSAIPGPRTRARLARTRGLLTHPYGAPTASAHTPRSAQAFRRDEGSVDRTGARTRPPDFDAEVARRVAERRDQEGERIALRRGHAARRVDAVASWPPGRRCPTARLREAWVARRHGLDAVTQGGTASADVPSPAVARRAARAIELFERHTEFRPRGWPESGAGALLVLAAQRRADWFAGDVARLMILARQMRAVALERDPSRRDRQAARARRRAAPWPAGIAFRAPAQRWETSEQRRRRIRDLVLLAGDDPAQWPNAELARKRYSPDSPALIEPDRCDALDGVGARAATYRTTHEGGATPCAEPTTKC
jgi:hypothetical protein